MSDETKFKIGDWLFLFLIIICLIICARALGQTAPSKIVAVMPDGTQADYTQSGQMKHIVGGVSVDGSPATFADMVIDNHIGTHAIDIRRSTGSVVRNVTVIGEDYGIDALGVTNLLVENYTVPGDNQQQYGIYCGTFPSLQGKPAIPSHSIFLINCSITIRKGQHCFRSYADLNVVSGCHFVNTGSYGGATINARNGTYYVSDGDDSGNGFGVGPNMASADNDSYFVSFHMSRWVTNTKNVIQFYPSSSSDLKGCTVRSSAGSVFAVWKASNARGSNMLRTAAVLHCEDSNFYGPGTLLSPESGPVDFQDCTFNGAPVDGTFSGGQK